MKAEVVHGEAAFYGPKIDFMVSDSLDREWQLGTIQVDYQLPKRFNLEYVDKNNSKKTPVLIHRAPFGSLERFIAILTEHCEGNFPLWIAPKQIIILPITEKVNEYAESIKKKLDNLNYRTSLDLRIEKISNTVSIRKKSIGDKGKVNLEKLITMLEDDMKS